MDKWLLLFLLEVVSPSLVTGCVEVDVDVVVEIWLREEDEGVDVDDEDADNVGLVEDWELIDEDEDVGGIEESETVWELCDA